MTTSGANMNRPRIAHAFSEALGLSDPHRTPPPPPDRRNSFIHQDSGIESLTRTSSLGIHDESQGYVEQHNSFRNSRPAQHKYGMSSLTSKAEGFRTWSGRASHRSRLSLRTLLGHHPKELAPAREEDTSVFTHQETPESRPSTAKGWLKRAASTSLRRNKRPSSSTPHGSGVIESKRPCVHYPGTEFGIEHSFTSLNLSGGAAARAAAAAHNEGSVRTQIPRERLMLENLRVTNDAESGIGIDMRDDSEESYLGSGSVTRKGMCVVDWQSNVS